jgi:hypothetical protein
MMTKLHFVLGLALVLLAPAAAHAQSGQVGSLTGYVFDEAGIPLKGIKISASSPTQIGGARVAYTTDEGSFRILQLAPGRFEVRAAAPQLETVIHKDINVGISAATEMNIVMKVQTKTEEVAIIEKAPVVVTTKANVKETFDLDMVENLPHGSRDNIHNQMVNDIAGGMNGRVRGGSAAQTIFSQDGFEMRGQFPTLKSSAAYEINSGGYGVDNPMAAGGTINLVTKSGSNKFEFEFNATADSSYLRFFTDEGDNQAPRYFFVVNPMISGPIIKDKLWFHFNTESHIIQEARDPDPEGIFPAAQTYQKFIQKGTLKLTWQVNNRNKLHSLTNMDSPHEWNMHDGVGITAEAQQNRHAFRLMQGGIWEALLTDSLVFRSQVGFIWIPQHIYPRSCESEPDTCDFEPRRIQKLPRTQEYGNNREHRREETTSIQFQNRLEFFVDDLFGNHAVQLKNNFYMERDERAISRPGDRLYEYLGGVPEQKTTYYSNDARFEDPRYGWWIGTSNAARHTVTFNDAWRPTRFVTLTPAISHVWARGGNSTNGSQQINAQAFAPAVSVAWDATHDGRTVLRGSYNQYVDINIFDLARHTVGSQLGQRCKYDAGGALDADGERFQKECEYTGGTTNTVGLPCGPNGLNVDGTPCREKLRIPRVFEYTAGAEREIFPGIALALDFIYRDFTRQYETRETNRVWNESGSQLAFTGRYRNGRNQTIMDLGTPEEAGREYKGVTLGFNKREGRFKLKGSYTLSSLEGNVFDGINNRWGDIAPRDVYLWGDLADDHRHELKMSATYQLTDWLSTGIRYRYNSGTPYSRLFRNDITTDYEDYRARVGINPGTNLNDPGDDRELRLPDIQDFNAQIRANLFPLIGQKLDFYVDVLNVLALRTPTAYGQEDGRNFGIMTSRMAPFRIRLGVNYKY